jgi:hypothetical protein
MRKILFILFLLLVLMPISVNAENLDLKANFTVSEYNITTGNFVIFTSDSVNNINQSWDFNGDNIIDGVNLTEIYYFHDKGTYTVTLTVFDDLGNNNSTSKIINVYDYMLDCNFRVSTVNTLVGNNISFIDESKSIFENIFYNWSFGDGTYSNLKNPVHKYNEAGNYSVTLSITNDNDTYSYMTKLNYIHIYGNSEDMYTVNQIRQIKHMEYFQTMPLFLGLLFIILFLLMIFSKDSLLKILFPIYCLILAIDIINGVYEYGYLDLFVIVMFLLISVKFNMDGD